ncbi:RNA polymerase sigma factor [Streptomyces showdoensis]|uniref:RNA polymerase sigma factor n=1 Tax=Streptomyces showdoensis TaxID=68268 RepID=UPI000F4F5C56|nr:RNA polymerase sigma factor [Streptomyces showdoensis]
MTSTEGSGPAARAAKDPERRKAMRDFYLAQHPRLDAFVARRVGGAQEAEDLCQETWRLFFVRYDHHVEFYDEPAKALYSIARCRIAEFWERRGIAREVPVDEPEMALLMRVMVTHLPVAIERGVDVERALAGLAHRQRVALCLRYLDDLSVAEVAVLMGIGENGVKKLLKRALATLRGASALEHYRPMATGKGECE